MVPTFVLTAAFGGFINPGPILVDVADDTFRIQAGSYDLGDTPDLTGLETRALAAELQGAGISMDGMITHFAVVDSSTGVTSAMMLIDEHNGIRRPANPNYTVDLTAEILFGEDGSIRVNDLADLDSADPGTDLAEFSWEWQDTIGDGLETRGMDVGDSIFYDWSSPTTELGVQFVTWNAKTEDWELVESYGFDDAASHRVYMVPGPCTLLALAGWFAIPGRRRRN